MLAVNYVVILQLIVVALRILFTVKRPKSDMWVIEATLQDGTHYLRVYDDQYILLKQEENIRAMNGKVLAMWEL
jgi:hypothetical protein